MGVSPGARFGPYEILTPIGKGGMGEVYRAGDTKLGREVAIKVLPEGLAADGERVARFEREAKLLAQLNHRNIATLHGLEELDGVHRDLKPANTMITVDGEIKILDFGLAKAFQDDSEPARDASQSNSPTLTKETALGVILGTASYMSPEQARGKSADKRTDLWAFGCCLYEALTGAKAFAGETVTDTLAAIVNTEPDWGKLPETTPAPVRRLLKRCLTKKVRERLTDAGMARIELAEPMREVASEAVPEKRRIPAARLLVGSVLGAVIALVFVTLRPSSSPEVRRLSVTPPSGYIDTSLPLPDIDISPDGRWIAFVGRDTTLSAGAYTQDKARLYLRAIDDYETRTIETGNGDATSPRFSPDSKWLAYYDDDANRILRVAVDGDRPEPACDVGDTGPDGFDWNAEGGIVLAAGGLIRCDAARGESESLRSVNPAEGEIEFGSPRMLPHGSAILFYVRTTLSEPELAVLPRGASDYRLLGVKGSSARYLRTGHLVYGHQGALRAVPFDVSSLAVTGESFLVLDGVRTKGTAADFSVSNDGHLIYVPGRASYYLSGRRSLVWANRNGGLEPLAAEPMGYTRVQISPDGRRVALEVRDETADVWLWDLGRETLQRVTFDPAIDGQPIWISNERLLFESHRAPQGNVFEKAADGTGVAVQVEETPEHQIPLSVSPDGAWFVFEERRSVTEFNIVSYSPVTGESKPLVATEYRETNAAISPDGRFIAYESNESGQDEVYIRPFPDVDGGKWQVSQSGGSNPIWSKDKDGKRELFFLDAEGYLSGVEMGIETDGRFTANRPRRILERRFAIFNPGNPYDVSPDGKRFLMIQDSAENAATEIHVVLNWLVEFETIAARHE